MMSARGKPKRLKHAWIKTLHRTREAQREFHDTGKAPQLVTYMVKVRKKART